MSMKHLCNDSDRKTGVLWEKPVIVLRVTPEEDNWDSWRKMWRREEQGGKRYKIIFCWKVGIFLFIDPYTNRNDASTKNHMEEDVLHEDAITSNENVYVILTLLCQK